MTKTSLKPWRNPDFEADLRRMLRLVRGSANAAPRPNEPFLHVLGVPTLLFQGESLTLLRSLQRRLAGSTHQGGVSPKEAETLLLDAASRALRGPYKTAEAWLIQEVESPLDEWFVVDRVEGLYIPVPRLAVGRSVYHRDLPRRLKKKHRAQMLAMADFGPPVIVTTVTARDARTAHVIASERFAESGAILDLIDRPRSEAGMFYALRSDGAGTLSSTRGGWILNDRCLDANGRLAPRTANFLALRTEMKPNVATGSAESWRRAGGSLLACVVRGQPTVW